MQIRLLAKSGLHIPSPKETFKIAASTYEHAATYHREFWEQTGDVIFPKRTPRQHVRDLRTFAPLHDAEIGFDAMERGEKRDDLELFYFGGAMVVKAMVRAYEKPEIPGFVTREIVGSVIEHHIVPEEQPLLSDELVERSEPPIHKYGRTVLNLFPSLENKL